MYNCIYTFIYVHTHTHLFSSNHLKVATIMTVDPEIPQQASPRISTFSYITISHPRKLTLFQ